MTKSMIKPDETKVPRACAGETLAGYQCEQRNECRAHAAINNETGTIGFMPMFRDELTGYCNQYRPA